MVYKLHQIGREEELAVFAERFKISVEELRRLNPQLRTFGGFPFGAVKISVGQHVKVPDWKRTAEVNKTEEEKKDDVEKMLLDSIDFDQKARYRCEQLNMTKIEDRIMFHFNTKKQYLLKNNLLGKISKIQLEEYLYKINPENLADSIEAMKQLEYAKENVILKFNDNGIEEILNYSKIRTDWNNFIPILKKMEFYTSLEKLNPNAAQDLLKGGNLAMF